MFQDPVKRCSQTVFHDLSHSFVVIPYKSASLVPIQKNPGDDSDPPPKKRGPLRPQERRDVPRRSWPPRGSLSSLFIPAGRPGIVLRRGAGRKETDL